MKFVLLLTVLSQVCLLVRAGATVQFKLVSFSNPDHKELDGDCCDDIFGGCDDFCDNRFIVCLDKVSTGTGGSSCGITRIDTAKVYDNNDGFNFPSTIPNYIPNPKTMTVLSWPGGMEVFVQVWDVDNNDDDKVDQDSRSINQAAARSLSSANWHEYTLGQQSIFRFRVKVYCNSNYYGSDCGEYCLPRDDQYGHYSCDPITGVKICYSGWEGTYCNIDSNECQSSPCANGVCVNGANKYSCICPNGWTGTNCDVNIDECASTPCKNGGMCNDHVDSFSCSCLPGYVYADQYCEYDDCAGQPCHNNATCLDLIGRFECLCSHGYHGDICQVDIDYCINQTCANNGTCVDRLRGFHCLCETGYEGAMCDVETDECASDPCMNNATCHDLDVEYRCTCQAGYKGDNCELEIDECLGSPCRNNATCEDELAGYLCHCADGFEGDSCQTDIDECAPFPCYTNETCVDEINGYRCLRMNLCDYIPCFNNATCLDDYPGFICECPAGYGGKTCAEDIDECASSPCIRGTCVDHLDGFSCLCPPGFAGETCHSEDNECLSSPCVHGTCVDLINGYVCNCTEGYTGLMCQNGTDECASSPCEHGRCVDGINGYTCDCNVLCDHGYCSDNGLCRCDDGYEGEDCSVQTDNCRSSPCSKGTCIPLLNGYRCECDQFHTGEYCENPVDDPCSLTPCKNGKCENTNSITTDNYVCTCESGFYGTNCDVDIQKFGVVIFITGKLQSASVFESNMASLLQKLYSSFPRHARDVTKSETVSVKIVLTEDYVKSTNNAPVTKVTFLAWTESGYLSKATTEGLLDGASPELLEELGHEVYDGAVEPFTGDQPDDPSWIGSHWYVILVIVAVAAVLVAVGFLVWRKIHTSHGKGAFKEPIRERGLPTLDPPDAAYSTRITNDFTTLTSTRPDRSNTVESVNPAYISSVDQPDQGCAYADEDISGDTGGTGIRISNCYAEIPVWKTESVANENPYSEMKY